MKNKIASEYEKKRWYRVLKSIYIIVFVLFLAGYNLLVFVEPDENMLLWFVVGNAIIIFSMGITEGLFWYIARGKWGYPKENESEN